MATVACRPAVAAYITLELSEGEAGALLDIASYGTDEFIRVFYEHLGRTYLEKNEVGLRSLFKSVRSEDTGIKRFLLKAKKAREVFHEGQ